MWGGGETRAFGCLRLRCHLGLVVANTLLVEELRELTSLVHFADNVAAADKLALDVELGGCGPVGEDFSG